ncbi:hypothetical protein IMG5_006080 [Ichthyophthirius multifiliis]|uniref:Uncharacterized protein n=1 Tax=Ichthyophthirius multifiliis TaxID=5932 RepID=G0QJK8_ICHMU|nr:hypothetical protein IMG5_006080 [Ichthyophthirius multifiliis]EGR34609.1 hypothetical protein IMG5_006080 [Ichthyophthirius multifiliis]|eukprot:XP_004039913.1 hypothetical protein IMG5_006080 [Ichthyophthirius multifiliis]
MSRTQPHFFPPQYRHNPLLLKDDVGKAKPSAYDLPPIEFTYGCPLKRDEEGAKEVSMSWKFHRETRDKIPDRDFAKLNKMSLTQGFHKARDLSQYRKQVDARKKLEKGHNALPLYIPEEEFRYGMPNRSSTPMKLVIGNCYGLEYQQRLEQEYVLRNQQSYIKCKQYPKGNKAKNVSDENQNLNNALPDQAVE